MALIADLADAVVAELNTATWSLPVTAVRKYLPQADLAEMDSLHVTVVPSTTLMSLVGRQARKRQLVVDVAVQQKVDIDDLDRIDSLVGLVEEIETFFLGRRIDVAGLKCVCVAIGEEGRAAFYYPHFAELHQFTSVSRFTFQVVA